MDSNETAVPHKYGLEAKLIAAARRLLETEGLEATTLRATARAAGVSHMAPYRHFENKDALLAAVAENGFRELSVAMDGAWHGEEQSVKIGAAYVVFAIENPALYRLMFNANLVPRERFPKLMQVSAVAFDKCVIATGALPNPSYAIDNEPPTEAIVLWALVHGLANLAVDGLVALPTEPQTRSLRIEKILQTLKSIPTI